MIIVFDVEIVFRALDGISSGLGVIEWILEIIHLGTN